MVESRRGNGYDFKPRSFEEMFDVYCEAMDKGVKENKPPIEVRVTPFETPRPGKQKVPDEYSTAIGLRVAGSDGGIFDLRTRILYWLSYPFRYINK